MGNRKDSKRRIRLLISLSASISLFLASVLLVIWSILLTDKTKSSHVRSENESSEIIRKNYIKGFENIENDGQFTFRFREDEINDFLYDGAKALNNKHIQNIYYERGQDNIHTFNVDLKKTFFKTRVVITTYLTESTSNRINLNIYSVKMGKVDATKYLVKKGYLTESFINDYFSKCNLPFLYNESSKAIQINAVDYINLFPKGEFSNLLWNQVLNINDCFTMNTNNLGITVDFSKLRTKAGLSKKTFDTPLTNLYQDVKDALEDVDFSTMSVGEEKIAYSLSEDKFDQVLTSCLTNDKEEISSSLLSSKATFEIIGTTSTFNYNDTIDVTFIYSLNGYLIDVQQTIEFYDYPGDYFYVDFAIKKSIKIANAEHNNNNDEYLKYFTSDFNAIYQNIAEKTGNLFSYAASTSSLKIDLESMNEAHLNASLRTSWKSTALDGANKVINFIVAKTL